MFRLRFRLALLIAGIAGLALLGIGVVVLLLDKSTQDANALYQSEVQQTRLVEGISRRITLIDADIAAVAIGHKPPLDAHEYVRRNRPQVEKMLAQLRSYYDNVSGERRDMLDAIDYNLPDFHQLLEEINQAYLAGDIEAVGEHLRLRWPIMRYALLGPLDRLLYLQQSELDATLAHMRQQGQMLRRTALLALLSCLIVVGLLGWRMWVFLRGDLKKLEHALSSILDGHAPETPSVHVTELGRMIDEVWLRIKNLQDFCTEHENSLALQKKILDAIPDGVCRLDRHGHLRYANPAAQHLLQASEAAFSASSHWPELLEKARQQGEAIGSDTVLRNAQERAHPVEIFIRYLSDHETDTPFLLILRDLTESQRKNTELMQAYHSIKHLEDEVAALRKELGSNRQLAFLGQLASVIVTPAHSTLATLETHLHELVAETTPSARTLTALHTGIVELRRLLQGLEEKPPAAEDLPKETANGIE